MFMECTVSLSILDIVCICVYSCVVHVTFAVLRHSRHACVLVWSFTNVRPMSVTEAER